MCHESPPIWSAFSHSSMSSSVKVRMNLSKWLAMASLPILSPCCIFFVCRLGRRFMLHKILFFIFAFSEFTNYQQFINSFAIQSVDGPATLASHGCPAETEQQSIKIRAPPAVRNLTYKFRVFGWPFRGRQNECTMFIITQVSSGDVGNVLKTQNEHTWAKHRLCKGGSMSYLRSSSVGVKQTDDCSVTFWKSSTPPHLAFFFMRACPRDACSDEQRIVSSIVLSDWNVIT